jgi:hypothetical protein
LKRFAVQIAVDSFVFRQKGKRLKLYDAPAGR